MSRLLLYVLLLTAASFAHARSYTASDKPLRPGWWHDPARAGWAFTLSPAGDELAGTLLTFDREGEATWYLAVGRGDGRSWTLPVTQHLWDVAANRPLRTESVGTFTFTLESEGHARASWTIAGESGNAALVPLELAPGYSAEDRSGHWFPQSEPGHGYTVYSQGDWLTLVHYGYDAAGKPRWVYADNKGDVARRKLDAVYFRRACASCNATVHDAGSITVDLPLEHEGTAALALSLPAPLTGGFTRPAQPIHLISDPPSGRVHPAALARFASDVTLRDYLGAALERTGGASTLCSGIDFSPQPAGSRSSSATNTQEADVDELDLVDNDGEYLYSIFPMTSIQPARLRTHRLQPASADLVLESDLVVERDRNAPQPQGVYLVEASEGPRLLALLSANFGGCSPVDAKTVLTIHGLAERGRPGIRDRLVIDGALIASRRIGRTLLLVTRHLGSLPGLAYGGTEATRARNRAILAGASLSQLVPMASLDGRAPAPIVTAATTLLPPLPRAERQDWLVTVTAVPLDDPGAHRSLSIIGQDSSVYVSARSLYLATSRYHERTNGLASPAYFTDVHRFGLDPLRYRASGSVRGTLAGTELDKPFRLSEHDDRLRVLSDVWPPFAPYGRYEITVLQDDAASKRMRTVGVVPNAQRPQSIGKPGETVRAVRFLGERAYVVTFRQQDPLYALDLSDPRDPRIAAEIEMPGFSSYLHPLANNVLLGVGLDANSGGITQGVKVESFDVATAATLRPVSLHVVGGQGSYTQLLGDHRAFAALRPPTGAQRFAFHAAVRMPPQPTEPGWDGLLTYTIDPRGLITPAATLRAPTAQPQGMSMPDGTLYGSTSTRAVLAQDAVYLYRGGWWFGARWGSGQLTPHR